MTDHRFATADAKAGHDMARTSSLRAWRDSVVDAGARPTRERSDCEDVDGDVYETIVAGDVLAVQRAPKR